METSCYTEKTPVHLNITFESASEAKQLRDELKTWTPRGGWSRLAEQFFLALEGAANK